MRLRGAVFLGVVTLVAGGAAVFEASSSDSSNSEHTGASTSASDIAVTIQDFAFDPPSISVKVGQTVTWTNTDMFNHSIKSANGSFNSPDLGHNATHSATFATAGKFAYICGIHNFMTGTVIVEAG